MDRGPQASAGGNETTRKDSEGNRLRSQQVNPTNLMQNYTTAVHVLRAYFQDRLKHHLPEYWGGKNPPIIPAQQQPEVVEGDTPFLVYIGSFGPTSDLFQYQTEVFNCSIYSTSPAK